MSFTRERRHRTAWGASGRGVRRLPVNRGISRVVTLVLAVGFAVVGVAGAASAHHNTITGSVVCKTGGGWAVTWAVENSETVPETIRASNRSAVPVGTRLTSRQVRTFAETISAKPTADVTLRLDARWDNGNTNTSYGTIAKSKFLDGCNVTTVQPPTIPVVDPCGPNNATYGPVPVGPWTAVTNPNGSVTVTANPGNTFPSGSSVTYPVPVDSNVPCPTPPVPPTPTPEPEPKQVKAEAKMVDKCGTIGDMFAVMKGKGVVYTADGQRIREGVWLKTGGDRRVVVKAKAASKKFKLVGKSKWVFRFDNHPCGNPDEPPNTGARTVA